jgi:protein tyrosine phosphatase (PTP) superfamily phosphohydrolase (DUF442 family)
MNAHMFVRSMRMKGLLLCLLATASLAWGFKPRGLPRQEGILNFGRISQQLYRGAQPDAAGVKRLHELGVKTIINLRMPGDSWKAEATEAIAHGILYTNVPFRGFGRPTDAQVNQVLDLIASLPGPVFIHCQHGCDRTGTVIACYRIRHDGWSRDNAMKEAARHGISWFERGMRKFVVEFARSAANPKAPAPRNRTGAVAELKRDGNRAGLRGN